MRDDASTRDVALRFIAAALQIAQIATARISFDGAHTNCPNDSPLRNETANYKTEIDEFVPKIKYSSAYYSIIS